MFKNKYFLILFALVIIIGGYYGYNNFLAKKELPYIWAEAKIGDIREIVSETGTVKAAKEINLNFKNTGIIKTIKVKVGDSVKTGDPLVILDTADLEIQARQARASRDSAKAKLDLLLAGASSEDIKVYETAVANAKENLTKVKESVDEDIKNALKSVETAETNLTNVRATAEVNLNNAYATALTTMQGNLVVISTSLTDMDNILGVDNTTINDAFEANLGILNPQTKIDAEASYYEAKIAKNETFEIVNNLSSNNQSGIEAAIPIVKNTLEKIATALSRTKALLDNTIASSSLTVADLSTKKTTIDTDRTSINTNLTLLETKEQNINSTKLTNKTNIDSAEKVLESAEQNLIAVKAKAATSISSAEGSLRTAEDQLNFKKASPREADLAYYQALVKQAEASLDLILKQIEDATLRSPVDGVIAKINYEVGEIVQASPLSATAVISLISSNNFEIEADVSELDINKIKLNDPVDVKIDALSETEVFKGKVVQIDPAEILKDSDIYYRIKVILDDKNIPLRSGMTADISIITNSKSGVIIIPERAIIKESGKRKVRLLEGDNIREVEVVTGLKGEEVIEVVSGVKVGDKVVTYIKE